MKKSILLSVFIFFSACVNAQSIITLQHGTTTTFEYRLDSAIAHAQNGDVIYLPGGLVAANGSGITINKKLTIIGAGYNPDSSNATGISTCLFGILFNPGSDSSQLTGIYGTGLVQICTSNISISRCNFLGAVSTTDNNNSLITSINNIVITENIIKGGLVNISPITVTNLFVKQNIFYNVISGAGMWYGTFRNNILLNDNCYSSIQNCTFENNIIITTNSNVANGQGANFNNNLFVYPSNPGLAGSGNVFGTSLASIFVNYQGSLTWDKTQNFHLKPGCQGIGLGNDLTDAGIYGTISPFKDGGMPFNPHFQSINIASQTNSNGKLPVNITVKAQNK